MITNTITGVSTMEAKQRTILQQGERIGPDSEVPQKPTRRRFTAEYKLRILRLADACTEPGSVGALLRRLSSAPVTILTSQRKGLCFLDPERIATELLESGNSLTFCASCRSHVTVPRHDYRASLDQLVSRTFQRT